MVVVIVVVVAAVVEPVNEPSSSTEMDPLAAHFETRKIGASVHRRRDHFTKDTLWTAGRIHVGPAARTQNELTRRACCTP
uniref:Putative secreted peptide n=1 Tax=Anopheles braziliensis TaxID=58242 RepID=A0A2M3ZWA5_9DIPT